LGVDDDDSRSRVAGKRHHSGHRIDLQAGANGDEEVGPGRSLHRPIDDLWHERLTEGNRGALQDATAFAARGIRVAGLHAIKCVFHRSTPATLHAHDIVHGAMHFNDTIRGIAGALVKSIYVLGDERVQLAAPL